MNRSGCSQDGNELQAVHQLRYAVVAGLPDPREAVYHRNLFAPRSGVRPSRVSPFRGAAMTAVTLDALDLAALLCSRVCHDVISPVGAIVNGLEVLEDEKDASMQEFALDLIKKSARQAS